MDRNLKSRSKPITVRKNPCLKSTLDKLYENREKTGNIKFIVDGEVIPAHRCILAALSPMFETQFYGGRSVLKDAMNIEDVSSDAFNEFLQFFYMDEVTLTLENIEDILNLAKQSLVDELVAECVNYLIDLVGSDKVVWCYRLALDYDIKSLDELCTKHISANIKTVFQSADFLSCKHDMLCQILDIPQLNCNESEKFDACISWAQAKCEQEGIDAAGLIYDVDLRMALGEATSRIHFNSMQLEEFRAIDKKFPDFFSAEELNEIFHEIALKVR